MSEVRDQIRNAGPSLAMAMRALYASEINCRIQSYWDGGWRVHIGLNEVGDWDAEKIFLHENFDDIPRWLIETAIELYPESDLARGAVTVR